MFRLAFNMALRDWRAGELRLLLAALVLSVAAISAVGFFADRLRAGMLRDSAQLLAADITVSSDLPLAPAWRAEAHRLDLRTAATSAMAGMASAGGNATLVSLKAVEPEYPLRGAVQLQGADGVTRTVQGGPARGEAWIDAAVAARLDTGIGRQLHIGAADFTVTGVIAVEPDRRPSPVSIAPRAMIAAADLPATDVMQPGVRARYTLLAAGAPDAVAAFLRHVKAANDPGVTVQTAQDAGRDLADILDKVRSFMSLAGVLAAILAAVAIAMAARRYLLRHLDACAMLRCLGLREGQVLALHVVEFALVGIAGGLLGVALGYASHVALLHWLRGMLPAGLPAPGWLPAVQGFVAAQVALAGFALPALLQMKGVPHVRLLRRETVAPRGATVAAFALGGATFAGLLLWTAGDAMLGLGAALGVLAAGGVFAACAWLALAALGRLRPGSAATAWGLATVSLRRHAGATVAQAVSLAIGLMALLLLTVVRGDLQAAWRASVPAGAANQLVFNIQPDQRDAVARRLGPYGAPALHPSIRGRLLEVNGKPVDGEDRGVAEVEMSSGAALPAASTVAQGQWFAPGDRAPQVSVGEQAAQRFNLKLGDTLVFDIGGLPLQAKVTSIRKIDWRRRTPSFDFFVNPAAAEDLPATYVAMFHAPDGDRAVGALARDYPNVSVIDIGYVIRQMQRVLEQATSAVEFLFVFTLAAGLLVLYAALAGSQDARTGQAALLRALGATRGRLSRAQAIELALTGALAGLLAAAGASIGGWALAHGIFDLTWGWPPMVWPVGIAAGMVCALAGGWPGLRHVLNQPPLQSLRQC
ncbi:FtsX-like permease family protein [Duganella sp. FT92W]|uniref:FtsX-like permease family protein n=1 Tax=Pseudoduganella rivuli TaxID=2666085 RepID=A0A7X2IRE4_9BURK|nr:FtsX-like permease family protein [Pseudoduganella rivuli]MRV74138.1 FtsX-like permease family protein [Pseudoduganella rivuli]